MWFICIATVWLEDNDDRFCTFDFMPCHDDKLYSSERLVSLCLNWCTGATSCWNASVNRDSIGLGLSPIWHQTNYLNYSLIGPLRTNITAICMLLVNTQWYVLPREISWTHFSDVIMGTIASQINSLTIVYSTVYSGTDQRKHQSSESLAFVRGIHRERWIPRTKGQ